jgi:E3 ubiquitin-protein ligase HUWE1
MPMNGSCSHHIQLYLIRSTELNSPVIDWFWEYVDSISLDQDKLQNLLQFCTGSRRTPAGGFAHLRGAYGEQRFNIALIEGGGGADIRYPGSHTCFNTLDIPSGYSSKDVLFERFDFALHRKNAVFGNA